MSNILNEMLFQVLLRLQSDSTEVGLDIGMINVEANEEVLQLKKAQSLQGPLPEFKLYFLGKGLRFDGARMNTD